MYSSDGESYSAYYLEKNLHNDVIAVYNSTGTKLVSYKYDAWGNFTVSYHNGANANSVALKNPFLYRGYYYDQELGLYYLQSRYYDSNTGRFINPDSSDVIAATPTGLTDKNLFAYCDNNPITRADDGGEWWHVLAGAIVGLAGQLASDLVTSAIDGELSISHWSAYVGAAAGGAVSALLGPAAGKVAGKLAGEIIGDMVGSAVSTTTSAIAYNIESWCTGRDSVYSTEEILYTSVTNSFASAAFSHADSKIPFLSKTAFSAGNFDVSWGKAFGASVSSIFSGIGNSSDFDWPNTHIWESPEPERWYPFK